MERDSAGKLKGVGKGKALKEIFSSPIAHNSSDVDGLLPTVMN